MEKSLAQSESSIKLGVTRQPQQVSVISAQKATWALPNACQACEPCSSVKAHTRIAVAGCKHMVLQQDNPTSTGVHKQSQHAGCHPE